MKDNSFKFLLRKIEIPKCLFLISIIISTIGALSSLIIPFLAGKLVDSFSLETNNNDIIIILTLLFVTTGVFSGLGNFFMGLVGEKIIYSIRSNFFEKIIRLEIKFFDNNDTGKLISRTVEDTNIINDFLSNKFPTIFPAFLTFIGSLVFLFLIDWKMTVLSLITLFLFVLFIIPIGKIVHNISLQTQNETANFSSFLNKIFTEIRLVKTSSTEFEEIKNAKVGLQKLYNLGVKETKVQSIINPISRLIMLLTIGVILGVGGVRVSLGIITSGQLMAMIFYVFQLSHPINELLNFFTSYKKTTGASQRIYDIFHDKEEDISICDGPQLPTSTITFKNVSFKYNNKIILQNLNFEIPKNKITAIVGPSGAGKTTILNIIERFYPIDTGDILYGEKSIYKLPLSYWRRNIGYVMQDNPMLNNSIKDNLLYGTSRNLSINDLVSYTKITESYDFISQAPDKFDTIIGERGIRISGGQKQRLDLTRNLIKDPPVLLFDEATSSLDSKTERKIQQAISQLNGYKTIVIVAHRLSTIQKAAQIVFVENQSITGIGTHEELLNKHKTYKLFVEAQDIYKNI
ncbi:ABC transporter ATP-binding protein [Staphylococcus aureus]|uniref:ABC transporter ATP-binding protein n=1 Tax=Staphylococcus aureus TaxID=1280 RepID=UPI000DFEDA5B|nr:ABC transporter ATP-binding protein [Staphylococcus aureus]SUJ05214.1 ABC transporter ATPase [Staphylococcus aureus]SUK33366.1 ABC transporter ATPase [Staphylococcus aureus]SUK65256.1 ABC transporter ATPase [Staphylococcus aureus]VTS64980.1 ABC transporter ATPase [Staphylococcus hyicus]